MPPFVIEVAELRAAVARSAEQLGPSAPAASSSGAAPTNMRTRSESSHHGSICAVQPSPQLNVAAAGGRRDCSGTTADAADAADAAVAAATARKRAALVAIVWV
jgi:hypothetical protein